MPSQNRKAAADREIGERHPYLTLYGGLFGLLFVVVAGAVLLVFTWSHRPDWDLPGPGGGSRPVLLLAALAPLTIALLWLWISPSKRLDRQIRRASRGR